MNADVPGGPGPAAALPAAACLLHIGPYKTASTALQTALADARPVLAEHGVAYPGRWRRAMRPGWAVLGYTPRGREKVPIEVWDNFAAEVRSLGEAGVRCCVSTEDLGSASPQVAERVVRDLGGERVHVVAVARRLDRLLPSQWQERIKSHDTHTYDAWLRRVLDGDATDREHRRFWASHDLGRMLDRWLPAVGPDRFTFVVLNEADPTAVLRAIESMLGLPTGLLVAPVGVNASLSTSATEFLRRVNEAFARHRWPDTAYHSLIQRGAILRMAQVPREPGERRAPDLPPWAAARVAELSEERAAVLRTRGVHVVGDPSAMLVQSPNGAGDPSEDVARSRAEEVLSVATAVAALDGAIGAAVAARSSVPVGQPAEDHVSVQKATAVQLLRALAARVKAAPAARRSKEGGRP